MLCSLFLSESDCQNSKASKTRCLEMRARRSTALVLTRQDSPNATKSSSAVAKENGAYHVIRALMIKQKPRIGAFDGGSTERLRSLVLDFGDTKGIEDHRAPQRRCGFAGKPVRTPFIRKRVRAPGADMVYRPEQYASISGDEKLLFHFRGPLTNHLLVLWSRMVLVKFLFVKRFFEPGVTKYAFLYLNH